MSSWTEYLRDEIILSNSALRKHSLNQRKLRLNTNGTERMETFYPSDKKKHHRLKHPAETIPGQSYHFMGNETSVPAGQNIIIFDLDIKGNNSVIITETEVTT